MELDDDEAQVQTVEPQMSHKLRTTPILLIVGAFVGCVLLAGVAHSQQKSSDLLATKADVSSIIMKVEEHLLYGRSTCPCIGIDGMEGTKEAGGSRVPAALGAHCQAWDEAEGKKDDWRKQKWCYVDPCNCKLPVPPKQQTYMPDARYRNEDIYYSYNTCGGTDLWTPKHNPKACPEQKDKKACAADKNKDGSAKCAWNDEDNACVGTEYAAECKKEAPEEKYGMSGCKCAGIEHQKGKVEFDLEGKKMEYPVDMGSTCEAWDAESSNPACQGDKPADWCKKKWCYVDPCECKLDVGPFVATYGDGEWEIAGRKTYYSYVTCGETNTFAKKGEKYEEPASCTKTD